MKKTKGKQDPMAPAEVAYELQAMALASRDRRKSKASTTPAKREKS